MTDRELLELAAKAAGIPYTKPHHDYNGSNGLEIGINPMRTQNWNPLTDDGDALRLAVKLGINVEFEGCKVVFADGNFSEFLADDPHKATRRAIVRAAAEIGKAMP